MTAIHTSLAEELRQEFCQVGAQLARARARQAHKDTTPNRAAVAECRTQIDAILDMHLDIRSL
ncbi:hypothetical protein [Geodermatophilus sp. SYSU D01176]